MTKSRWPNEYDRMNMTEWIWPNEYDRMNLTKICEHDRKLTTRTSTWWTWPKFKIKIAPTTNMSGWIWPKIEIICYISTFGQIQSFSVEFNKLTFVVVIFWSCSNSYGLSVSVIFKPIFGHIDSVKLLASAY